MSERRRHQGYKYGAVSQEDEMEGEKTQPTYHKDTHWWNTLTPYKIYILILLLATYLLNQLDRYMLAITTKSVAQEIHYGDKACMDNTTFTKAEIGNTKCNATEEMNCTSTMTLNGSLVCKWDYNGQGWDYQIIVGPVFILVYTFTGIFIGFAADLLNRKIMLACCLIFWSAMTLLTAFVNEYWQLVVLRFGLGIGEAGCTPFAVSIIGDYFTPESRGFALGIYNWGIYMGYSMSYAFGNFITVANINNQGWRWSFIFSGAPGILLGILILATLKEPERQRSPSEKKDSTQVTGFTRILRILMHFLNPSLILICLAGSVRNASGYVFGYNSQVYFQDIGQTKEQIGEYMSWIPIVGGSISVLLGGFISDRIVKRLGLYSRVIVIIISLVLAAPFAAGTLYFSPPYAYVCQIPTYIFGEMWIGITLAVILELVPSDIKTSAVATYLFIITNIGGNTPLLVPPITQHFKDVGYEGKGEALRAALYILYPGPYIYAAGVYLLTMFVVKRDQKKAQQGNYVEMDNTSVDN